MAEHDLLEGVRDEEHSNLSRRAGRRRDCMLTEGLALNSDIDFAFGSNIPQTRLVSTPSSFSKSIDIEV